MKKNYFSPATIIVSISTEMLLAASDGINGRLDGTNIDAQYGGIDETGTKDPSARRQHDVWDDDTDE